MTTMEEEEAKKRNGDATATAPNGPSESYAAMMDAKAEAQDMRDTIRENGGTGLAGMKARTYFDESASPAQNQPAQDWRAPEQTVAQKKPVPYADRTIMQTPNGRAVYFGSASGAADAAKAAVQYENERQGIVGNAQAAAKDQYALKKPEDEKYRQSQIAALQRQGYNDRMQNGFRNDAIVTDAFAALYGQWKGTEAGEDGKSRAGLVREALRDVNDRLADGGASYRVLGMSVVGKKDGDPVFRIVTTDRNGKRNVMTRSMDEVYNTRLNAYNGLYADASKGDEKTGAPSGNESRVISEFGDRRGVQKRYELINREQIERERANQAREKLTQDQLAESRRATDEANRMKALGMLRDFSANNGGRQMSEQQYMMKILGDPKARASYETVPEFETEKDRNGNTVVDANGKPVYKKDASGNLIPAYETDKDGKPVLDVETGKPVQKTRTLSPDEVVKRVQDEYRSIMSDPGAQANGQSAPNPFLEAMYSLHPEWRPKAENTAPNPVQGGANPAQNGGVTEKIVPDGDDIKAAQAALAARAKANAQNGAAPSAQAQRQAPASRGTISPVTRPNGQTGNDEGVLGVDETTGRPIVRNLGIARPDTTVDKLDAPVTDSERAEAMEQLGLREYSGNVSGGVTGANVDLASFASDKPMGVKSKDETEKMIRDRVMLNRKNKAEAETGNAEMMAARNRRAEKERADGIRKTYDAKTGADDLLNLKDEELGIAGNRKDGELRGKELTDALAENFAVGRQQREAIQRSRRDAERRSEKDAERDERITSLFRAQRERREANETDAASRRDSKARAEREARLEAFIKKNAQELLDVASTGDTDAVRRYMMAQNEKWSDADVEETTRILEELSM